MESAIPPRPFAKPNGQGFLAERKMKNYLSIDIDYWTNPDAAEKSLTRLLLRRGNIPINALMNHQQMTKFVDNSGANLLINVDKHSDICSSDIRRFECGSWVSYIKWRKTGEYLWIRSDRDFCCGSCNGDRFWSEDNDWGKVKSIHHKQDIDLCEYLPECTGIGLCMSPQYANYDIRELFKMIIKAFNIPYKKGRRNENYGRTRKPPQRIK